ncbi:hypothetical protein ACFL29_01390 [Patescibacteria group bacterium]
MEKTRDQEIKEKKAAKKPNKKATKKLAVEAQPVRMVKTLDGKTVPMEEAICLNYRRLGFAQKLLRENLLRIPRNANPVTELEQEKDALRIARLKLLQAAIAHSREMSAKGPSARAFASTDSDLAKAFQQAFGSSELSTPPESWGENYKVPELFVFLPDAQASWEKKQAEREKERSEEQAERQAKAEAAAKAKATADAERERQAKETEALADQILGVVGGGTLEELKSESEERQAQADERKATADERKAKAEGFFKTALVGHMTAQAYKNHNTGRLSVSNEDPRVLSLYGLAQYHGLQQNERVSSMVDGSSFEDEIGATYATRDGKPRSSLMVATFQVRLVEQNGRMLKDREGNFVTSSAFIIMSSHETRTLRRVAEDMGLVDWSDPDSRLAFNQKYHIQPLQRAAKWAWEILNRAHDRRQNRDSSGEDNKSDCSSDAPAPPSDEVKKQSPRSKGKDKRSAKSDSKPSSGRPKTPPPKVEVEEDDENSSETSTPTPPASHSELGDVEPLTQKPFAVLQAKGK